MFRSCNKNYVNIFVFNKFPVILLYFSYIAYIFFTPFIVIPLSLSKNLISLIISTCFEV